MTVVISISNEAPDLALPGLKLANDHQTGLKNIQEALLQAGQVVVICGAGISVGAGIPDFRSRNGLFQEVRAQYRGSGITSGKDLFDASLFLSSSHTSMFYQLMGRLAIISQAATPTPFHQLLKELDSRGSLLRVYTQNIDGLEEKAGLSFGMRSHVETPTHVGSQTRWLAQPSHPRCIPLHGHLGMVRCNQGHLISMDGHAHIFASGVASSCPECNIARQRRIDMGKRPHAISSHLRPDVLLYGEAHPDPDLLQRIIYGDVKSLLQSARSKPSILLVVGTSLKVDGAQNLVSQISSSLRQQQSSVPLGSISNTPIRTIYLDLKWLHPNSKWSEVFDIWVQGDAQMFAQMFLPALQQSPEGLGSEVFTPLPPSTAAKRPSMVNGAESAGHTDSDVKKNVQNISLSPAAERKMGARLERIAEMGLYTPVVLSYFQRMQKLPNIKELKALTAISACALTESGLIDPVRTPPLHLYQTHRNFSKKWEKQKSRDKRFSEVKNA